MTTTTDTPTPETLRPNSLWRTPAREVVQVSTVYGPDRVTATLVYPIPGRTTVRSYSAADVARWTEPSDALIARYEIAWGFR